MFVCLYDRSSFVALYYYAMVVDFIMITHDVVAIASALVCWALIKLWAWCSIFWMVEGRGKGKEENTHQEILWVQQKVMYRVIS